MLPHINRLYGRFEQELSTVDEVVHSILKGHLLLEEQLNHVLEANLPGSSYLDELRLTFAQKVALSKAFALHGADKDETWSLILAINSARNVLAHRLDQTDRAKKLAALRGLFLAQRRASPNHAAMSELPDASLVILACGLASGFLAEFAADAMRRRQLLHEALIAETSPNPPASPK